MIICPACHEEQPAGTWPWISMDWDATAPGRTPWWCATCLAKRIAAAHADDCRCEGCTHQRSSEGLVA